LTFGVPVPVTLGTTLEFGLVAPCANAAVPVVTASVMAAKTVATLRIARLRVGDGYSSQANAEPFEEFEDAFIVLCSAASILTACLSAILRA
jgi:hypothetical protein